MVAFQNKWFCFVCLLFLVKPGCISGISSLQIIDKFFDIMRFVIMILCVMLLFVKKGKLYKNKSLVVLGLIILNEIWKFFSTMRNGYSYNSWGTTLNTLGITLFCYLAINQNKKAFFEGSSLLFGSYVIINTLTVLLFPNGMYTSSFYSQNFFLSYRNAWFIFYLIALYICLLNNELYPTRQTKMWLVAVIVSEYISMIRQWTANGLFCITIGLFLFLLWKKHKNYAFPVWAVILSELAVAVGLIFFHIQERVLFLIVGVLKKDPSLTQRVRIWNNALESIKDSFWIGHGSMSSTTASTFLGYGVNHAHSYYLNTIFYFGIIGLVIGLCIIYYAFSDSKEKTSQNGRTIHFVNTSMLVALLTGFQGESMMSIGYYLCLMYVVAAYTSSPSFNKAPIVVNSKEDMC